MKKILILTTLLLSFSLNAQNNDEVRIDSIIKHTPSWKPDLKNPTNFKEIVGIYGGGMSGGFILFENGTFAVFGYATLMAGHYSFEGDNIILKEIDTPMFSIYGYKNPEIKSGNVLHFSSSFDTEESFVRINNGPIKRVFNKDANCFGGNYDIHLPKGKEVKKISIFSRDGNYYEEEIMSDLHLFTPDKDYNEYYIFKNRKDTKLFEAIGWLKLIENKTVAFIFPYFSEGVIKKDFNNENKEDINWLENYAKKILNFSQEAIYVDNHKDFDRVPDELNYTFDAKKNQYIDLHNKGDYLQKLEYIPLKRIAPQKINTEEINDSFFIRNCDGGKNPRRKIYTGD